MYNMYKMIRKQPNAVQYAIEKCAKEYGKTAKLMKNKRVYLTGCGSSFHAAIYGEFVLRAAGFDAHAVHAFDMIHYTPTLKDSLAIVISHSWKTRTTLKALDVLKRSKVPRIGISANEKAYEDIHVLLRTSDYYDESDCVTMGYTTELAALALMTESNMKQIKGIPSLIEDALDAEEQVRKLVDKYGDRKRFFVLGVGPNVATAYEMALKMKEGNFTDAEGMQLEQMLHGSISGIDDEDVVFLIAPKDSKTRYRVYEAAQALSKIGASTIAVTDGATEIAKESDDVIKIGHSNEYLNPLVSIVPLQLFAYFMAEKNGINPDLTREDDTRYRKAYAAVFLHLK